MIDVVNISDKLSLFDALWQPHIVGELNGQYVKLAKLKGEFVWHSHEHEDELFLVLKGQLIIELRDEILTINEGEMVVIPKGVEHKPIADAEVHVLLFEPKSTINTGETQNSFTHKKLNKI